MGQFLIYVKLWAKDQRIGTFFWPKNYNENEEKYSHWLEKVEIAQNCTCGGKFKIKKIDEFVHILHILNSVGKTKAQNRKNCKIQCDFDFLKVWNSYIPLRNWSSKKI